MPCNQYPDAAGIRSPMQPVSGRTRRLQFHPTSIRTHLAPGAFLEDSLLPGAQLLHPTHIFFLLMSVPRCYLPSSDRKRRVLLISFLNLLLIHFSVCHCRFSIAIVVVPTSIAIRCCSLVSCCFRIVSSCYRIVSRMMCRC